MAYKFSCFLCNFHKTRLYKLEIGYKKNMETKTPTAIMDFTDDMRLFIPTQNVNYSRSYSKEPLSLNPLIYKFFPHTPESNQLFIFISGDCLSVDKNYTHTLQPGDVCFTDENNFGYTKVLSNATYERIVLKVKTNSKLKELINKAFDGEKRIVNLDLQQDVIPFFKRFEEYSKRLPLSEFSDLAENMVEELVYLCLMKKMAANDTLDPAETLLRKALTYIDEKWGSIQSVQEISNALFISPSYLYEIFNKKMRLTPKAYLTQTRMQMAHAMLTTGVAPNEVSRAVGFTTYTAFYRSFKAFFGKKPQDAWLKSDK